MLPEFRSIAVKTKAEALAELAALADAKVIAGGTDLLVRMRRGESHAAVIDVSGVPEMAGIEEREGIVNIGAGVTHAAIARSGLVGNHAPGLAHACGQVGSPQIRNMGTIGGNIVNASPAADSLPPLLVHDALLTVESNPLSPPFGRDHTNTPPFGRDHTNTPPFGRDHTNTPPFGKGGQGGFVRTLSLEDFIVSPYKTSIAADELLTCITIKGLAGYREGYRRVAKRAAWAISRLSVAWAIREEDGLFRDVRLAIGSCTPMPFRARDVEAYLMGKEKTDEVIGEAARMLIDGIRAASGERPSFAYKFPVLEGMVKAILNFELRD